MNYLELINRYWQEVDIKGFTPAEATIYFRLLDICNRLGWTNPFSLSNPRAVALMAISENTLIAGRDRLVMKGLIGYNKGSRRQKEPLYCFPERVDGEWVFAAGFTSNIAAKQGVKPAAKQGVKPGAYNKTKTKQKLLGTTEVVPSESGGVLEGLFDNGDNPRKKKGPKEPPINPSFEEVRELFLVYNADSRLQDWESSARLFFDTRSEVGWVNAQGRSIVKLDSAVSKWITYRELEEKEKSNQRKQYENQQGDKFSRRRGAEPTTKDRKNFNDTL